MNSASGRPAAVVYVQHLLGIGHLARMARVTSALRDAGIRTTLVKGGMPLAAFAVDGIETIQLDPVRADPSALNQLLGVDGMPFDDERRAKRRDHLMAIVARSRPDILLVEAFPFGRRAMRFELVPLLESARDLGVRIVASSVRDILQESRKAGRAEESAETVERWFDFVLVHGDRALTPLGATFPLADRIADKTVYTGLVAPELPAKTVSAHDVIVSVGGGAVGEELLHAAAAVSGVAPFSGMRWLLLAGPNMAEDSFRALAAQGCARVEVRRFVNDLPARLAGARVSVSQAGYNTVADLLVARCRAVLVPFEAGGETEQVTRARLMADRGFAVMLREHEASAATLAAAMGEALRLPLPAAPVALDGAAATARTLLTKLRQV